MELFGIITANIYSVVMYVLLGLTFLIAVAIFIQGVIEVSRDVRDDMKYFFWAKKQDRAARK